MHTTVIVIELKQDQQTYETKNKRMHYAIFCGPCMIINRQALKLKKKATKHIKGLTLKIVLSNA